MYRIKSVHKNDLELILIIGINLSVSYFIVQALVSVRVCVFNRRTAWSLKRVWWHSVTP